LELAVKNGDAQGVTYVAHKIKAASANVGGMQLSNLAGLIEEGVNPRVWSLQVTKWLSYINTIQS